MDLGLSNKLFIVTGTTGGLGNAVATRLINEGAKVIGSARRGEILSMMEAKFEGQFQGVQGDVANEETLFKLVNTVGDQYLDGIFVNAGGPPAKAIKETDMQDWDHAYLTLLRWKVMLIKLLIPKFVEQGYGRILFSESSSIKQPIENLVLSTSLRLAVAGFAKTLSEEYAQKGLTANIIAPGYHDTDAVDRLFKKKSENLNITFEEAKRSTIKNIKVGKMGNPDDFASLAVWLLSPHSSFVTGQVYSLDGGNIKSTL
jgi:3-oxoacyl-[acyl-carrier protein] reductase